MGLFLLGPLAQQLQDAADSRAPVLPATRLLTVLVPLVYRPALKVGSHVPGCRACAGSGRQLAWACPPARCGAGLVQAQR